MSAVSRFIITRALPMIVPPLGLYTTILAKLIPHELFY
jgi:hypothetical protein